MNEDEETLIIPLFVNRNYTLEQVQEYQAHNILTQTCSKTYWL